MEAPFSPDQFRAVLRSKGWKNKDLAKHWGISVVHMSRLIGDPDRPPHWNDAVVGLPRYAHLAPDLAARRSRVDAMLRNHPLPKRPGPKGPRSPVATILEFSGDYRYRGYLTVGAILTATQDIGEMAEEGGRAIVFAVIDTGIGERYGVIFESGDFDWFLPHHVDACLAGTGLDAAETVGYVYQGERVLIDDFNRGHFDFW
ncbi:hypothetical protein M4D49_27495 [Cupriavidus pauculus]|uniref:hypothetical protein n=1 Tax=Burkholderiaceae TaxID=119060 RepID=UPI0009B83C3F|nr:MULTISPECIES: hypothetical protein [Burkholderiaceae]MCM3609235.1 hypothetical protein [Cupriavidus pauculus]